MSLKNRNFLFSILFIIITFRKINPEPHDPGPPSKVPNNDEIEKDLDDFPPEHEPPKNIKKNTKIINENNNNNNMNNNKNINNNNKTNNNNINNDSNTNEVDISNKLKEINELKEKTKDISMKNDDSKNKLQKYHLYYYIMVILNITFAIIISFLSFIKYIIVIIPI